MADRVFESPPTQNYRISKIKEKELNKMKVIIVKPFTNP